MNLDLQRWSYDFPYQTRQATGGHVRHSLDSVAEGSFISRGTTAYNRIPDSLRSTSSLPLFKKKLKNWTLANIPIEQPFKLCKNLQYLLFIDTIYLYCTIFSCNKSVNHLITEANKLYFTLSNSCSSALIEAAHRSLLCPSFFSIPWDSFVFVGVIAYRVGCDLLPHIQSYT